MAGSCCVGYAGGGGVGCSGGVDGGKLFDTLRSFQAVASLTIAQSIGLARGTKVNLNIENDENKLRRDPRKTVSRLKEKWRRQGDLNPRSSLTPTLH